MLLSIQKNFYVMITPAPPPVSKNILIAAEALKIPINNTKHDHYSYSRLVNRYAEGNEKSFPPYHIVLFYLSFFKQLIN